MSIAIIIPAYKESDNIEKLIFSILNFLEHPIIIIVDDSPNKETQEKLKILITFVIFTVARS